MRLTHIKLSGFKSFADLTTIHVPGQRVGVVGPNGCGKSNVIDAVRWVLGESSAKQLRGEHMQDVIFNGATSRPPASRASVELIFDNSDFALSGAWGQFAEVSIKRTLNRAGDSAYFINQQQVRRRDITDLFLGTGVGSKGYAVIEQGMISRIIEAKPEELRGYIEEAAGVSKYKERRRETESRLRETKENLNRLNDVESELDTQAEKLQKQAQTALRYLSIKSELTLAQNRLDFLLWQSALDETDQHQLEHNRFQAACDELSAQQTSLNERIYQLQMAEYDTRSRETQINQQHALAREEMVRLEEQMRHHAQMRHQREKEEATLQIEIEQLKRRLSENEEQRQDLQLRCEEANLKAEEMRMKCDLASESLPQLKITAEQASKDYEEAKSKVAHWQHEAALHQQNRQRNAQEKARLQERLPEHQENWTPPDFSDLENLLAQLVIRAETIQERYDETSERLRLMAEKQKQALEQQQQLEKKRIALETELQTLQAMLPENDESDFWQHFPDIHAPALWQEMQVDIHWQHALSVVLGEKIFTRYIPDFKPEINTLPSGKASWIFRQPESTLSVHEHSLWHKIQCSEPFSSALKIWLNSILYAENLTEALQNQHLLQDTQCYVTPEGHYVDAFSVILYGEFDNNSVLARQNRVQELMQIIESMHPEIENAQQLSGSLKEQYERIVEEEQEIQRLHQQLLQQIKTNEEQLLREKIEAEAAEKRRSEKIQERETTLAHIAQIEADDEILSVKIEEAHTQIFEAEDALMVAEETLSRTKLQLDTAQEKIVQEERAAHQAAMDAQQLTQQYQTLEQDSIALNTRKDALLQKQGELQLSTNDAENDDETQRQQRIDVLSEQIQQLSQQLTEIENERKQQQKNLEEARQKSTQLESSLPDAREKQQAAILAAQQAKLTAEHHLQHLQDRAADIAALTEDKNHGKSSAQLTQIITDTSRRLNQLGSVNLAAKDELEQLNQRRQYLTQQHEDLSNAMSLLEQAIEQIDKESEKLFQNTFESANRLMQHYFPVLFGGGEAHLTLENKDLLSAGVSIMARPPGKKNSTIHLLSGGEKTLTAMSLVFSLFSLNPAPFCLLDEVDAPLDDANTGRFCRLLEEMSDKTQFLYISHSRVTMESAQQLIGVTMQEKGVSRIVSVDIQAALQMAEPSS